MNQPVVGRGPRGAFESPRSFSRLSCEKEPPEVLSRPEKPTSDRSSQGMEVRTRRGVEQSPSPQVRDPRPVLSRLRRS